MEMILILMLLYGLVKYLRKLFKKNKTNFSINLQELKFSLKFLIDIFICYNLNI